MRQPLNWRTPASWALYVAELAVLVWGLYLFGRFSYAAGRASRLPEVPEGVQVTDGSGRTFYLWNPRRPEFPADDTVSRPER